MTLHLELPGSGGKLDRLLGKLDGQLVSAGLDEGLADLDGRLNHVRDLDRRRPQLDPAAVDPGDLQKIVHQPHQVVHLALERVANALGEA